MSYEPEFMVTAMKRLDEQRERLSSWWPTAHAAVRSIEKLGSEPLKWRASVGYEFGSLQGVLLMADDVTDLRQVVPLLRELRREGWRVDKHDDNKDLNGRTYFMKSADETPRGPLVVRVFFPWDKAAAEKATCKFVQTGVKEEPVYEVICSGETTPELAEVSS